jgi:hypothetical protein
LRKTYLNSLQVGLDNRLLLFVVVNLLKEIILEVAPLVIASLNRFQVRKLSLILIKEHLEDYILVLIILMIENELHITCHREDAVVEPTILVKVVKRHLLAIAVKVEEADERHNHSVMTIAERCTRMWESKTRISL